MKKILFTFLILTSINTFSQDQQKEINTQVWKPFIETFNNHNTEGFMAVHSKDLVRVPRDSKVVYNFEQYRKINKNGSENPETKRNIALHFTERIASTTQAYEVGIFKVTITKPQKESQSFYGKFHVVLHKENGIWKILVDSDSSEGNTITEKDFLAAQPME